MDPIATDQFEDARGYAGRQILAQMLADWLG
jgi:hypothetical protein